MRVFTAGVWIIATVLAGPCFAAEDASLLHCQLTPATSGVSYPGEKKIIPSARLARPDGKAEFAPGVLLYVTGRITDRNCVPIQGAVVEVWQENADGVTRYLTSGDIAASNRPFAGTGRAHTDNLGRYAFLTIYPGAGKKEAPHIHFRIKHKDVGTFYTEMFFEGDPGNNSDKRYRALKPKVRDAITTQVEAGADNSPAHVRFDIAVPGKVEYKKF